MMTTATVNAKVLEEVIKKGYTLPKLAEELKLSERRLITLINNSFQSRAAKSYLRRLEKNKDKKKPNGRGVSKQKVEAKVVSKPTAKDQQIAQIEEEIKTLNENCAKEEANHQGLISRRNNLKQEAKSIHHELEELIQKYTQRVNDTTDSLKKVEEEIVLSNEAISKYREQIEFDELRLEEIKEVVIYAFGSGEIQIDSEDSVSANEDDVNAKFMSLITDTRVQKLSVIEVKQISKLLVLKETNMIRVIFDKKETEEVYRQISST